MSSFYDRRARSVYRFAQVLCRTLDVLNTLDWARFFVPILT
ncbi:hypothetical protein [Bacteroides sp.]|nr:hypothetical protein [Bacteroides sp.]